MPCSLQAPCGGVLWYDQWHQDHKEASVPGMARCLNGHTFLAGSVQTLEVKVRLCGRHKLPCPCVKCREHWQAHGALANAKRRKASS